MGPQRLIDLFVVPQGVIAVQADRVALFGRDRQLLRSVAFPREITAAALDGTRLVIADRAALTVMTTDLAMGPFALLTESCASGVLVSGGRFVCGPGNDWDRVFYTYDVAAPQPARIATSAKYTYNGIPMRRVPGSDDFVTVSTDSSPSDFHLYRVDATGTAVFINESPYHGAFAASMTFAFDGTPAQHLIQAQGLLLKLYGPSCDSTSGSFGSGCFIKDGVLGTLRGQEGHLALADDGAGRLFSLTSPGGWFPYEGPCRMGCAVQRIDFATRTILSEKVHAITDIGAVVRAAPDTVCGRLVLGYLTPGSDYLQPGGSRVQSFDY